MPTMLNIGLKWHYRGFVTGKQGNARACVNFGNAEVLYFVCMINFSLFP